jgi:hypothetical protein
VLDKIAHVTYPASLGDESTVNGKGRVTLVAWVSLSVVGLYIFALSTAHTHDPHRSLQVTAPHTCFLCQVSPNVDVEIGFDPSDEVLPLVSEPQLPSLLTPPEPDIVSGSARSPPL